MIEIEHADGSKEEIEGGINDTKDAEGNKTAQRPATDDNIARLTSIAGDFENAVAPLDSTVVKVQEFGGNAEVYYDDGTKEEIEIGVYEIKDANNDTILERPVTDADIARLGSLAPGDLGSDDQGSDPGAGAQVIVCAGGDSKLDGTSGGGGNDEVDGQKGNDTLDGGSGSDLYDGGLGEDVFVFGVDGVKDDIKNFEDGADLIDISAFGVADASALSMTQVDLNRVLIDLGGGDTIEVRDVNLEQLTDADFIF